jgi:hypothetical protein
MHSPFFTRRFWRPPAERSEEASGEGREDQDLRPSRAQVLDVDRWFHLSRVEHVQEGVFVYLFSFSFSLRRFRFISFALSVS